MIGVPFAVDGSRAMTSLGPAALRTAKRLGWNHRRHSRECIRAAPSPPSSVWLRARRPRNHRSDCRALHDPRRDRTGEGYPGRRDARMWRAGPTTIAATTRRPGRGTASTPLTHRTEQVRTDPIHKCEKREGRIMLAEEGDLLDRILAAVTSVEMDVTRRAGVIPR